MWFIYKGSKHVKEAAEAIKFIISKHVGGQEQ